MFPLNLVPLNRCLLVNSIYIFFSGIPDKIDPAALPLTQPAASWVWLVDLERALALLVGQSFGGMLAGPPISLEEKKCERWLKSSLLGNGLEDRDPERGDNGDGCIFPFFLETSTEFILLIYCTQQKKPWWFPYQVL